MMQRINPLYVKRDNEEKYDQVKSLPNIVTESNQLEIIIYLQNRVIDLENKLNDMKMTVDYLHKDLKEKTDFINLILEKERSLNEAKKMNEI